MGISRAEKKLNEIQAREELARRKAEGLDKFTVTNWICLALSTVTILAFVHFCENIAK